jgi:type 1 glutamine amidotransferase/sugar phosphate isomerase/epimerase
MRAVFLMIVAGAVIGSGQVPSPPPGSANSPANSSTIAGPAPGSLSVRLEDWGKLRTAAFPVLGWRVGIAADRFRNLTFYEAATKADELGVGSIQGSGSQKVSAEIPKNLDYNLAPGELNGVKERLRALSMRMPAYFTNTIGPEESASRKLFEFAKGLGIETIISSPPRESLPAIDKLANEFGINVALETRHAKETLSALAGLSKRIGVCADPGAYRQEGIKPVDGLALFKDRVITVNLRDFSIAGLTEFIREMYRLELKPSLITVDTTGASDTFADLSRSFDSLEKALQPVAGDRVNQMSRAAAIRGPERLTPEERQKIEAALPKQAAAKPKKPRKLLVLDLNIAYGGHRSIPAQNLALELMGKNTGAYEAVFSNDLDNLKSDKIRQFDAVFLNNTVGMIFVDAEVRDGLTRFVREGGGLAGNHGTSHASMDWPEFGELIGTRHGIHREPTEQAMVKIDDPNSPLTAAFGGKEFLYQDEFFRFPTGPYSREKLHVLLSIDVAKTDMYQGRGCAKPCVRPDYDYGVSWIQSYGKGRVFFCILGHNPTLFTTPQLAQYFLAGIQFILGDLEADTTPSAKLAARKQE